MADKSNNDAKGLYLFGIPIWENPTAANKRREDREDRQETRQDGRTERVDTRQGARTDRTVARCSDGSCGAEATIGSIGDAAGDLLGGLGSGLTSGILGPVVTVGVVAVGGYALYRFSQS